MEMQSVKSSQIKAIGHSGTTLAVRFNSGGLYHYPDFSAKQYAEFKAAPSLGSYFGKHIKTRKFLKIDETKKEK